MDHGKAVELGKDNASDIKAKAGLVMFAIYSVVYAGFVIINTVSPKTMGIQVIFGLNLAVVYGFGLILLAIAMGLAYNHYCTKKEIELNKEEENAKAEDK